jgi:predicted metal-dependent hydrolase
MLQTAIHHFNHHEFFRCHEVLEEVWTHEHGPRRLFLQSLIHLAVAFYHWQQGNPAGAEAQLRKGLHKLESYLPAYEAIDTLRLSRDAQAALDRITQHAHGWEYPRIHLAARNQE